MPLASEGREVGENSRRLCALGSQVSAQALWALREMRLLLLLASLPRGWVGGPAGAVLTQAEERGHCVVAQDSIEGNQDKTTTNTFQGVVCEQSRDLGHRSYMSPGQGHSPLGSAQLVHPSWMGTALAVSKAKCMFTAP